MLTKMVVHMVYYIKEMLAYCRIYFTQLFKFVLNCPVLFGNPTSVGLQTVLMIGDSCYFRS